MVGYYTLTAGSVSKADVPPRVSKGLGNYPIPIVLLARLAVDLAEKGKGLGKALLKDSLLKTFRIADIVGCRAMIVHAKDDASRQFYEKFGFEPSPTENLHLCLLMKDIKTSLGDAGT